MKTIRLALPLVVLALAITACSDHPTGSTAAPAGASYEGGLTLGSGDRTSSDSTSTTTATTTTDGGLTLGSGNRTRSDSTSNTTATTTTEGGGLTLGSGN